MLVDLKNVGGSSKHETTPSGQTWKEHWERAKRVSFPSKCVCCNNGRAEVGGHVYVDGRGQKQYIVPMCRTCNGKPAGSFFFGVEDKWLVPVNDD